MDLGTIPYAEFRAFTQEEVDQMLQGTPAMDSNGDGVPFCVMPFGDYRQVKEFRTNGIRLLFLPGCLFGPNTRFARWTMTVFGRGCQIEEGAVFEGDAKFDPGCSVCGAVFRAQASFGDSCTVTDCTFQAQVWFNRCTLAGRNLIKFKATFLDDCLYRSSFLYIRGHRVCRMLSVGPIGSRNDITLFFSTLEEDDSPSRIYVSTGCFFGTLEEFRRAVRRKHPVKWQGKDPQSHPRRDYLAAIALAKKALGEQREKEEE